MDKVVGKNTHPATLSRLAALASARWSRGGGLRPIVMVPATVPGGGPRRLTQYQSPTSRSGLLWFARCGAVLASQLNEVCRGPACAMAYGIHARVRGPPLRVEATTSDLANCCSLRKRKSAEPRRTPVEHGVPPGTWRAAPDQAK